MPTTNTMHKIVFKVEKLATSAITRASRGTLILVIDDINVQGLKTYTKLKNVTDNYEDKNKAYITKAFTDYKVKKVMVASGHDADNGIIGSIDGSLTLLNKVAENGWLVCPQIDQDSEKKKVSDFIKMQRNEEDYPIKSVLYNYSADNEGIVNFTGEGMENSKGETIDPEDYLVDVACYLCTLGANEGITNHTALNTVKCDAKSDNDASVANGELFLYNNGINIVFSRGVNSKTTLGENDSVALTKIRVVEIIDMVKSDVRTIMNEKYIGKIGNSYSNRKTVINTLNNYLGTLTTQGYLSNDEDDLSYAELDVDATRNYLESQGTDTEEMTDEEVLRARLGSYMFIKIVLKVMDVIEDIEIVLQYVI